jgi:hypothetical protein
MAGMATFSASALAVGATFLLPHPTTAPSTSTKDFKIVGRYCLIRPGEVRPHCDGEGDSPKDPMLSAIKQMSDSLTPGGMDRTPP